MAVFFVDISLPSSYNMDKPFRKNHCESASD